MVEATKQYVLAGGTQGTQNAVLAWLDERIKAEVREGRLTVDAAVAEMKAARADLDSWKQQVEAEWRKTIVPGSSDNYSLGRISKALVTGDVRYAPHEWEVSCSMQDVAMPPGEKYTQATTPGTAGGFTIPGEFVNTIIEKVKPQSVVMSLGAREMPFTTTPVNIPRQLTRTQQQNQTEGGTLQKQTMTFGQMELTPKKMGMFIEGTREFFEMGDAASQFMEDELVRETRIKIDEWALRGGADPREPVGVYNYAGVNSVDWSSTTVKTFGSYEKLIEMESAPVEASWDAPTRPGWAINPRFGRAMRLIKSEDSAGGAHGDVQRVIYSQAAENMILGYPFRRTNLLLGSAAAPTVTQAVYGDWPEMIIGRWFAMRIERTQTGGDAFEKDTEKIKAVAHRDVGIWHPEAFSIASGFNTTGI